MPWIVTHGLFEFFKGVGRKPPNMPQIICMPALYVLLLSAESWDVNGFLCAHTLEFIRFMKDLSVDIQLYKL